MRTKLIYFLYRCVQAAAFPLLILYFVRRCARDRRYLNGGLERFGFLPAFYKRTSYGAVWLHAVSVGEALSAVQLVKRLRIEMPDAGIFVSCGTVAGRKAAEDKLRDSVDGIFCAPFDWVFTVRRVLRTLKPAVLVVLETEIWPNLFREAKRSGCGLVVVNGRMSPNTAGSYGRWRSFFAPVLRHVDLALTQSDDDVQRYVAAGAPAERVFIGGNLKYDFDPVEAELPTDLRDWIASTDMIWVAASTSAPMKAGDVDEDDAAIAAHRKLLERFPSLVLAIAPRKPERFGVVAEKLERSGLRWARRSALQKREGESVLLLDSIGELGALFAYADVVFMGGTLAHRGGHNVLEPASSGRAVVVGPHLENFPEIATRFRSGAGFLEIENGDDLEPAVARLLGDEHARSELGERGRSIAESQRGATGRAVRAILDARDASVPRVLPWGLLQLPGKLAAAIWLIGGRWKRDHGLRSQTTLPAAVVSVGGLAMGGSGKTPFVRFLVERLTARGVRCAILTRGYRRQSSAPLIVGPGTATSVEDTGDEAQMYVRDGLAAVGVGSHRAQTADLILEHFRPDLFVLDDGFQHARVARNLDIVVLDGLDPFASGELFPLGRLREPVSALRRAHAVVISRAESGRRYTGVVDTLARVAPGVPVFRCSTVAKHWTDFATEEQLPAEAFADVKALAFCGLGNPATFWKTLDALRVQVVAREAFRDHHRYTDGEVARLNERAVAAGATVLLTTEKDAMNVPQNVVGTLPLHWVRIGVQMEDEASFLEMVTRVTAH